MTRYIYRLALCITLLSLAGCALAEYKRLNRENVAKIRKGVTTEAEVEALLGRNNGRLQNGDGTVTLVYETQMDSPVPGTYPNIRTLTIYIGSNGVVTNYNYTDMTGGFLRLDTYHSTADQAGSTH